MPANGAKLELDLEHQHAEYLRDGLAKIERVHPPSANSKGGGGFRRPVKKGPPDFRGRVIVPRIKVRFEAKEFNGRRFPFAKLRPKQAAFLAGMFDDDHVAFLVLDGLGARWFVPWTGELQAAWYKWHARVLVAKWNKENGRSFERSKPGTAGLGRRELEDIGTEIGPKANWLPALLAWNERRAE